VTIRNFFLDPGKKLIETPTENVVVILAQGIASHFADLTPLTPIPGFVVHADHNDAAHFGQNGRRMPPRLSMLVHVFHFTRETLLKPGTQFIESIRWCRGGNSGKLKTEFVRVVRDANGKRSHELILATRDSPEIR
jgi:hypothetical protein